MNKIHAYLSLSLSLSLSPSLSREKLRGGGCTNYRKRGGVCRRHGAYRTIHDEFTAL